MIGSWCLFIYLWVCYISFYGGFWGSFFLFSYTNGATSGALSSVDARFEASTLFEFATLLTTPLIDFYFRLNQKDIGLSMRGNGVGK